MIAFSNNQPNEAIKHNQQAIRLDPENMDALHNMGLVYLETKRSGEAIPWFRKALALAERPDILFHLAMAYEEKGHSKMAVENYQRCLNKAKSADPFRDQAKQRLSLLGFRSQM